MEAVRDFRERKKGSGLYETYADDNDLDKRLQLWLTKMASKHGGPIGTVMNAPPKRRSQTNLKATLTGSDRKPRIEVRNNGTTEVRQVSLTIPDEVNWMSIYQEEPIDTLRAGESVRLMCGTHMGSGPTYFDLAIDGIGEDGQPIETQFSKISR